MLRLRSAILDTLCNPTCHRIPERSRRVRTQKKQPQDASTSSAILDTLCNPACLAILPAIGSLSEVEGPALKKKQPQDASTTLSNPGHVMQACLPSNPTCHRIPERSRRGRTQKKQPQDASTSSAILDGLSNPGRLSKAAIYFVMERATRKPASVPHLPVSSSLAEPSTTTFFISSMRCNRLHCMLRHFFWL